MSKPIEHSPEPWVEDYYQFEMNQLAWCIRDAQGGTVVEGNPYSSGPLDDNGKLLALAPTMYHIIRAIVDPNKAISAVGLMDANILVADLEGRPDAEA